MVFYFLFNTAPYAAEFQSAISPTIFIGAHPKFMIYMSVRILQ